MNLVYLISLFLSSSFLLLQCNSDASLVGNNTGLINTIENNPHLKEGSIDADIVVYGATSSGVMAAIQASRMNKKVVLILTPNETIGGMSTNGLSNTDIGNVTAIGGLASEFYSNIGSHYNLPTKFTFEPKIAMEVFLQMMKREDIILVKANNFNTIKSVKIENGYIQNIVTNDGKIIYGKIFIDASYEGDLMAVSNVDYIVGRESNSMYSEKLNGVTPPILSWVVSVFKIKNDEKSGVLPNISTISSFNKIGLGDNKIQPYNFRLCMTTKKDNQIMIEKPAEYNIYDYELLVRYANLNPKNNFLSVVPLPNNKFDVNNEGFISTDLPGINFDYPKGDDEMRLKIKNKIKNYMLGFIWTLQNDVRIPLEVRNKYSNLGLAKDEFVDNNNWPFEVYVRESRRLIGEYVMTEHDIYSKTKINDSIGMGSYNIDSHPVQYEISSRNLLAIEGGLFYPISKPYPISYKCILPKREQCRNLLVSVCVSASHVALSSMRMEPVYMILGQSAAIAASLSIESNVAIHDLRYDILKVSLLTAGQKLY
ncbi:FAD-dependent oxidoreductase [Emticicia sp. W12TSBA100-4]|uniref:FAD-dependent oxidoreductase n=1 Tax=Emticicia sp. W12TSBA100-4 TaxID=3160965 RepID=UPI003306790F